MNRSLQEKYHQVPGPVLILGASGFIGANLLHSFLRVRRDVFGVSSHAQPWRLDDLPKENILVYDLLVTSHIQQLLDRVRPQTVFDCIAYGAYSFETEWERIHQTNFNLVVRLLQELQSRNIHCYIHAGSSSEYGESCNAPDEMAECLPNSHYAVSKVAAAAAIRFMGRRHGLPCANLRLYSVYGPLEDPARLIPNLIIHGERGQLPPFVDPNIARDFIFVDDACESFVDAALHLTPKDYGASFNIGSGHSTTIRHVAEEARKLFGIAEQPHFTMPNRSWDLPEWCANPARAKQVLCWEPRTSFLEGLQRTREWYTTLADRQAYQASSKQVTLSDRYSISAIIACYKDGQAIPLMHERLTKVLQKMGVDYEIIFVNDCSPDDSQEIIRRLSFADSRVMGITHSRNFGSQAAFMSGMEISGKRACVLLDGDLQDPPELLEQFLAKWREGYDVVYGRRVKRVAPWHMQIAYKLFYRVFGWFSYLHIPRDAGDFSLLTRPVVEAMLRFPERDLFLRGVRAFVGFHQTGVDYVRPERMFGVTTNNLLKNLNWAKIGILSFSNVPLNLLTAISLGLVLVVMLLVGYVIISKLIWPDMAPHGITTLMLMIMFFGSVNLLAISLVGEYIAKIFNETKQRPLFVRRSFIRHGEVRPFSGTGKR
ncbi:MAG: NAD-dependent epimerase/dehydratase family protein [Magnetococcales bacterium]|nr:NAD-dependent epimerase/dehydratase family protein [Magnetococcales bacterium]